MIILRHNRSAQTYLLVQTLRSWKYHINYDMVDMFRFYKTLLYNRYNGRAAIKYELPYETTTQLNNILWGQTPNMVKPLTLAKFEFHSGRGIPFTTIDNTQYIARVFDGTRFLVTPKKTFLENTLDEYIKNPLNIAKAYNVPVPKDEVTFNRYIKVAHHINKIIQLSPHQLNLGPLPPITNDQPNIIYVGDVGARHSREQITRCMSAIDETISTELWDVIEQSLDRYLLSNTTSQYKEQRTKLHIVLRKFIPKLKNKEEFENYVTV